MAGTQDAGFARSRTHAKLRSRSAVAPLGLPPHPHERASRMSSDEENRPIGQIWFEQHLLVVSYKVADSRPNFHEPASPHRRDRKRLLRMGQVSQCPSIVRSANLQGIFRNPAIRLIGASSWPAKFKRLLAKFPTRQKREFSSQDQGIIGREQRNSENCAR